MPGEEATPGSPSCSWPPGLICVGGVEQGGDGVERAPFCPCPLLFVAGRDGGTYEEELVEFLPHGLAHVLLHDRERLHEVLRSGVGGGRRDCRAAPGRAAPRRPAGAAALTCSVRLACRWLLLWSVLPMALSRLCTTRRCSISWARLVLLRARTLGRGFALRPPLGARVPGRCAGARGQR